VSEASSIQHPTGDPRQRLVHRVLRWIAILGIFYGMVGLVSCVVELALNGLSFDIYPRVLALGRTAQLSAMLVDGVLLIGAFGLLRWRRWGGILVLIWAPTRLILELLGCLFFAIAYSGMLSQSRQSMAPILWPMAIAWLSGNAFPILMLILVRQPEVTALWSNPPASAFEVIPLAERASAEEQ
jgi:hypothetical protein